MDSRIREIEQWVTEAKTDLGEHGREAYLNKLYLLDAEIRSVIRESGMQPAAASPQSAGRRVRRQHAIPVFASGALGVTLAVVSTVYFAFPGLSFPAGSQPASRMAAVPATQYIYVPVPQGEELVDFNRSGEALLTQLPGSPSEEKAGEVTPSNEQASADGTAVSPVSSKPSALAQSPTQMPVTIPAARESTKPAASQPQPSSKQPEPKLVASVPEKTPVRAAEALPAETQRSSASAQESSAVQIIPTSSVSDVNKVAVDSGDKPRLPDPKALDKLLRDKLEGKNS